MIAQGLINLGFVPNVDFIAQDDGEGPYLKAWLSQEPQPSAEAIAAAALIPVYPTRFSFLEFMDLFTDPEQIAIVNAAMVNAGVKLWYDKALGASYIDRTDQRTIDGVNALVPAGLITSDRAAAILAGIPPSP